MTRVLYFILAICLLASRQIHADEVPAAPSSVPPGDMVTFTVPPAPAATGPASQVNAVAIAPAADACRLPRPVEAVANKDIPLSNTPPIEDVPVADLWQRIREGMVLPEMDSPMVHSNERWFASRPSYMSATLDRARLYLFHIVDEVEKRHMPMEIALLPIVESSYNPQAQSPSDAAGIWQFLPSTGRLFGLKQNGWYDGRRDVVNATDAALDYLERLHDMFDDWELALAAYNCGEGCVSRAIAKNRAKGRGTDFLSLDLPAQTRGYVPRLLAIRNIVRDPAKFGVALDNIPNEPAFRKVTLQFPIEAKTAARLAEMSIDDFLALNPGFHRRVIYSESQNTLLLPPDKVDAFKANLAATEAASIRLHAFHAPKGALLSRIADRFDVTIRWLNDHNPLTTRHGKLAKAQTLMLPPGTSKSALTKPFTVAEAHENRTSAHRPRARHVGRTRVHTVRRGETLYGLARHYNVKVADILELNGAHKTLHPGDRIEIPSES